MSRVWLRIAGTSDATKYSPSPRPITTGGPERAATILLRILARDHAQREHAGQLAHRVAHRVFQIPVVIFFDQMRDHFGVGFGDEGVAFGDQLALQRQIIFDDAVVHHHDVAVAVAMRMRVFLGGAAVRGPARVADAEVALHRIQLQHLFQVAQFAGGAPHRQAAVSRAPPGQPNRSRDTPGASGRQ